MTVRSQLVVLLLIAVAPWGNAENINIFDFSLTDKEMAEIAALNRNEKHDWY